MGDYATPVVRRAETQWFKFNLSAEAVEDVVEGLNQEGYNADADYTPQYVDEPVEYCFSPVKLRNQDAGVIEISELELKNGDAIVKWPEGTYAENKRESNAVGGEADNAIDGNVSTKWVSIHPTTLCVVPPTHINMTSFRFVTADGSSGRDPVQWKFERSQGANLTLLHLQSLDFATPTRRQ